MAKKVFYDDDARTPRAWLAQKFYITPLRPPWVQKAAMCYQ